MTWAVRARIGIGAGLGVVLEPARQLPAVHDREAHVHEDEVGLLGAGHVGPLAAVGGEATS